VKRGPPPALQYPNLWTNCCRFGKATGSAPNQSLSSSTSPSYHDSTTSTSPFFAIRTKQHAKEEAGHSSSVAFSHASRSSNYGSKEGSKDSGRSRRSRPDSLQDSANAPANGRDSLEEPETPVWLNEMGLSISETVTPTALAVAAEAGAGPSSLADSRVQLLHHSGSFHGNSKEQSSPTTPQRGQQVRPSLSLSATLAMSLSALLRHSPALPSPTSVTRGQKIFGGGRRSYVMFASPNDCVPVRLDGHVGAPPDALPRLFQETAAGAR
jgi:hypothetical protein